MMPNWKLSPVASDVASLAIPSMPRPRGVARFATREEPRLSELLNDPITQRLMASDGVGLDHLNEVVATARAGLKLRLGL